MAKTPEKQNTPPKAKTYKTYECRIEGYFDDGSDLISNHISPSHGAARYAFWNKHSECLSSFKECIYAIKTKSIGAVRPSQFYGQEDDFKRMCKLRNIEFAYQGMVVDVAGKKGWLVGSNASLNMDVLFEGTDHISNCHPYWETTFYDDHMNVVKDFKEPKSKEETH